MYGLMKAHVCSRHAEEAQQRRMHYCGTCKTMGRLYGQQTRFLLNNDAIFLAELLTALTSGPEVAPEWASSYRSYNCFHLPSDQAEMPLPLQVAASATVVMAEFKVADQITDGGGAGWKVARRFLSPAFASAEERLKGWGFPIEEFWRWGKVQDEREAEAREATQPLDFDALTALAEPTATVTGLVFEHGAAVMNSILCDLDTQRGMYLVGYAFGELIYTLDAYEDYARDVRRGDFNAFQLLFQTGESVLSGVHTEMVVEHLHGLRDRMETALRTLPLPPKQLAMFLSRLRTNLDRRLAEPGSQQKTGKGDATSTTSTTSTMHSTMQMVPNLMRVVLSPFFRNGVHGEPALATADGRATGLHRASQGHPGGVPLETGIASSSSVQTTRVRRGRRPSSCCNGCCTCCDDIVCCGDGCCCACEGCECATGLCADGCGSCG